MKVFHAVLAICFMVSLIFSASITQAQQAQNTAQVDMTEYVSSCSETEMQGTWKLTYVHQKPEGDTFDAFQKGHIDYLVIGSGLRLEFFTTQDSFTSERQVEVRLIEIHEMFDYIPHRLRLGKNDVMQMTRNGEPFEYFRCNLAKQPMGDAVKIGDMIWTSSRGSNELFRVFKKL